MVPQRGLGPPFWFPGGSGPPFWVYKGPMWPKVPPARFMDDFGIHFGGHLESKINYIWCRVWMCFRDACLSGSRMVLGMFWQTC